MTVLLLGRHEVEESLSRVFSVSGGDEPSGCLRQVPRPDQMVSTQVVVALGETPWNRETSDHCARVGFFLVCSEDSVTDPIQVESGLVRLPKIHALRLDLFPSINKRPLDPIEVLQQGIPGLLSRLVRRSSESNSGYTLAIIARQVEFCGQSNVSVRRCGIFPCHLLVGTDILPTIADTNVSTAHLPERGRTSKGKGDSFSLRKKHRCTLVVADPPVVSISTVSNVRGEQSIDAVVPESALARIEVNLLQEHVSLWIGDDGLRHPVTTSLAGVDES